MTPAGRAVLSAVFLQTVFWSNTFLAYAQDAQAPAPQQATVQQATLSANVTLQAQDVSHFDPAKYTLPIPDKNTTSVAAKAARVESAVTTAQAFASRIPGFVSASGQNFILNGKAAYFAGTNAWYLPIRATYSDSQISQFFSVMSGQGVTLVRVFCFEDGYSLSNSPIQTSPGSYDENGLKRIDLIMATAAQYGIYVIVVPTNFEPVGGGISWYVDQLVGSGNDKELFYTDGRCKQAYKNYVSMLLNRVNTYTGVQYKNDPTMFSFELMNEPHTRDLYEINRGLPPGKLVRDWIYEMSAFVKSIDSNHMVSTGEEGYRADGPTNPPHNNWINGGWKGVDFVGNVNCPHIDFATTHVYPDNWAIQAYEFDWVNANFIRDRASIAHAANKPIIMEETGMQRGYLSSRNTLLSSLFGEANNDNFGATMIWEWIAWNIDDRSYDFSVGQDGSSAEQAQINYMTSKSGGAITPPGPPSGPPSGGSCTNTPPDSSASCAQQVVWHPGCTVAWLQSPYCDQECGRCSGSPSGSSCSDNPPTNTYTCAQQAGWGKCGETWMQGFCNQSCGRCSSSCSDNHPPSSAYSCNQQAGWGKCGESWMQGYCNQSCGRCSSSCPDNPPPGSAYSCSQQATWGKCTESWMRGYCNQSCGRCFSVCPNSLPPDSAYSCGQQAGWGKCNESWMTGYCLKSCGKC